MINIDTRLLETLNESEFYTICHLAKYLGKEHSCFPSKGRLQKDTGFGRHKLEKAVKGLVEKGLVKKEQRKRSGNNTFQSNIYTFTTEFISVYVNAKGKQIADVSFSDVGSADVGSADVGKQDNKVLSSIEVLTNKEALVSNKSEAHAKTEKINSDSKQPIQEELNWVQVARDMAEWLGNEGADQWRFMCEQAGGYVEPITIASAWAGKYSDSQYMLRKWKKEACKLQNWIRNELKSNHIQQAKIKKVSNGKQRISTDPLVTSSQLEQAYRELIAEGYK